MILIDNVYALEKWVGRVLTLRKSQAIHIVERIFLIQTNLDNFSP